MTEYSSAHVDDRAGEAADGIANIARKTLSRPVSRAAEILNDTAESIDDALLNGGASLPASARSAATSVSSKLRNLASRVNEDEATQLILSLQNSAAKHPATAVGIGAALGAALGIALAKLGTGSSEPSPVKVETA